ncbi:hypothetical protein GGR51DRAFT_562505 [Nemania sp. FL0031]|nr:hypothetical protein GGR51DRAFT_562505 [Nemania sp. FL0031]
MSPAPDLSRRCGNLVRHLRSHVAPYSRHLSRMMNTSYLGLFLIIILFLRRHIFRYIRHSLSSQSSSSSPANPSVTKSSAPRGVRLFQVYPPPESDTETDIDIIAIHGLDTRSPDTWTWKESGKPDVNWLCDENMLPRRVAAARIFMCDWPSNLFESSGYSQKTFDEFARLLLAGIAARLRPANYGKYKERPIFFIASCLGGVILMKALVRTSPGYRSVQKAVHGIVFLATPFSGTSFRDVAEWALPGIKTWAFIRTKKVSNLLYETISNPELNNLCRDFTALYQKDVHMEAFYETGETSLPRKLIPWLPAFLAQRKPLVGWESAALHVIHDPLPLKRIHLLMNKFSGPSDEEYNIVAGRICDVLDRIRKGRTRAMADAYIKITCYKAENLRIERISGDLLPMERCYINLAIVDQLIKKQTKNQDLPQSSLDYRLNTFTPHEEMQVDIWRLFDERRDNGDIIQPRRVLIRGHAGVGKSTLCKKIVHDFKEHGMWRNMFERILWVPLRNLKRLNKSNCNLQAMLYEEYFTQTPKGNDFACELWKHLEEETYKKTLFLLDGLDEVYEGLDKDNYMFNILETLLNLPTVILTSRPHVSLAGRLELKFDLELETVGFYPHQVKLYIENVFTPHTKGEPDRQKVDGLQTLLEHHQLLKGLVRIPIQLDALCYIWSDDTNSLRDGSVLETMTGIYQAIVNMLWEKDITRLQKKDDGKIISRPEIRGASLEMIKTYVHSELCLLEGLAFTGMVNDTISFTRNYCIGILEGGNSQILLGKTLPLLSFLRTSNPSSRDPIYHFLHMTFQEYFAARYFVRHWTARKPLFFSKDEPSKGLEIFVAHHIYDARYNIFWRFVSGLLSFEDKEIGQFFRLICYEPRDRLGTVHARLIMHCLSEVPPGKAAFSSERRKLEYALERWLTFETSMGKAALAREMECPEALLTNVLESVEIRERKVLLKSLEYLPVIPSRVIRLLYSWLTGGNIGHNFKIAILSLLALYKGPLDNEVLDAIVSHLEDCKVQETLISRNEAMRFSFRMHILNAVVTRAIDEGYPYYLTTMKLLSECSRLDDKVINALVEQLENKTRMQSHQRHVSEAQVRRIIEALACQPRLGEEALRVISAQLHNNDYYIRRAVVETLKKQPYLSDDTLATITTALEEKNLDVLEAVIRVLGSWPHPNAKIEGIVRSQLKREDWCVRQRVMIALREWPQLSHGIIENIKAQSIDQEEDIYVRCGAIRALMKHQQVDDIHEMITTWLQDEKWDLRCAVIEAFQSSPQPSAKIVDMVVAHLEEDLSIKMYALRALTNWPQLSNNALDAIAKRLTDNDEAVQEMAAGAFLNQPRPEDSVIKTVGTVLSHLLSRKFNYIRPEMERLFATLETWSPLDSNILNTLVKLLRTTGCDLSVKRAVLRIFRAQHQPNDGIIECVKECLGDTQGRVRHVALRLLGSWPHLQDKLLVNIAVRLDDEEWDARQAAFYALTNRSSLPFRVLKPFMESMYKVALEISLDEHVYWYIGTEQSFIVVGARKVHWEMREDSTGSDLESESNISVDDALWLRDRAPKWREEYRARREREALLEDI